jgi:pimeloyl-ACP methyl ester carboxylesterase
MSPLRTGLPVLAALIASNAACSTAVQQGPVRFGNASQEIVVPGLGACREQQSGALQLDPARPLVLLVHGCRASGAKFRTLAQVFEAHGQQTACFNYDDRDSLDVSSEQLRDAIEALALQSRNKDLTVLGHSQGGLVSRRALVMERPDGALKAHGLNLRLVTVSSPFGGIAASRHCGWLPLHVATFGVSAAICQLAAGNKWMEIHPDSRLVEHPGTLVPGVQGFLKIVTDERGTCFEKNASGGCRKSDFVFSMEEQRNAVMDADPREKSEVLPDGHSGVVGQNGIVPVKLIKVLQEQGVMAKTPADRRAELDRWLAALYVDAIGL